MKKTFLALSVLFSLGAATATARVACWGVTGGMNVSKIDWKNVKNTKPESEKGWYAGITGKLTIPGVGLGIDGGVVYSQEGIDTGIDNVKTDAAQFLSVPIHLRYDLQIWGVEEIFIPFAMIGPQFNYSMNELKFEDFEGQSLGYIVKKANTWRLDMGAGFILWDHLQLSYSYGIPLGQAIQIDEEQGTTTFNYNLGTHRIGVVYYF